MGQGAEEMPWAASERGPDGLDLPVMQRRPARRASRRTTTAGSIPERLGGGASVAECFEAAPAATRVNSPANDDESILQPGAETLKVRGALL
jgi:hypothetical protein